MSCLYPFVVVLGAVISGGVDQAPLEVQEEPSRQHVTMPRPGMLPLVVPASDEIVARAELTGIWQVVTMEYEGQPRPDLAAGLRMRFTRGRLELMQQGRQTMVVAYRPIPNNEPRLFTWVLRSQGCLFMQRGVYRLQGDDLMLCVGPTNERRAIDFLTQPGDGRTLYVLRRVGL